MLDAFWAPSSVAVIGASKSPGKVGNRILANLIECGYEGEIVPVNPTATQIMGRRCYPNLAAYGRPVDLAVVVVPRAGVMDAVRDCVAAGVKALVVITAGFKEVGAEGAALERELVTLCRSRGVRLIGPNCLGILNTATKLNASFANEWPARGHISFFSQSGALVSAILDYAVVHGLGISKMISMGNKADVDENDLIQALSQDNDTRVIVGYLESIMDGNRFLRIAETAASRKPIVIFKSGVTQAGVRAASSHTGSLAGADIAYGAAFRRAGVIRAETFEQMIDYAMAFAMQPLPKGNRVAVITNAGGPGIMAADAVEQTGLVMSSLTPETADALRKQLPPAASVANPVDVLGDADPERYAMAVRMVLQDAQVDMVLVLLTPQAVTQVVKTAEAVASAVDGSKPVLVSFMGGRDVAPAVRLLMERGIPNYPSPERAVQVLYAMYQYVAWLKRPPRVIMRFPVNRRRAERILQRHLRMGQFQVGEAAAKDILRAYDFNVPPGAHVLTADEAIEAAERIGYPVAMKIVSRDIIHKSDLGGVRLNLDSPEAVRDAFDLMMVRIRQRVPEARLEGVYVEKMCPRGREVILGMVRDPQFGPMLMFGLGGIFVEVMKDVTFHIAPITRDEARQMLEGTRSYALLMGARGQARVDVDAIAESLQRISQLVTDFPEIQEMDINPFIVGPVGGVSLAADARITLRPRRQG
jgi:acetyltransferase